MKEAGGIASPKICSTWVISERKSSLGQSVDIRHLGKYLRKTKDKAYKHFVEKGFDENTAANLAEDRMMSDLKAGVQTIQYQINTLYTTNGRDVQNVTMHRN